MTAASQPVSKQPLPPAPGADADSAFFWSGLREHKLLLQQCTSCRRFRFPAMPSCPYCASRDSSVSAASGTGSIYSWIVVHRAFDPAFSSEVPYTLASVDLDEGGRVVARIQGPAKAAFGLRVKALFVDHADWTELRFQPINL